MATVVTGFHAQQPSRLQSFVIPREHGAWGILLIPLVTGACIGFRPGRGALPLILFSVAALSLFCLRTPVEAWLGASALRPATGAERRVVFFSILGYAGLAILATGWLLLEVRAVGLVFLGVAAGLAVGLQAGFKRLGRPARMAAQWVGAIGLTSTAAGGYYVATGGLGPLAFILWAVNWLFAVNQIHFVQVRIHGARAPGFREKSALGAGFLANEAVTALILLAAWRAELLPGLAALAFVPVLVRGLCWFLEGEKPLVIQHLGFTELAHALAFGALFILGFLR